MPPSREQSWWAYALDRWGFPVVVVLAGSWAVWTVLTSIASWAAPKADLLIDTHVTAIKQLTEDSGDNKNSISKIADLMQDDKRKLDEIHRAVVKPKDMAHRGEE